MESRRLARKPLGEAAIDYCTACSALWFDAFESVQLTPGATLALFEIIRNASVSTGQPLPSRLPCPRCTLPLEITHDLQRTTRFTYYRCTFGHGRFTPFVQFLREKDFIRPLSPAELARLRDSIKIIQCSSCGAPVDLARDAACPYCRAPISILDPAAVNATVTSLEDAERKRTTIDVEAFVDGMLDLRDDAGSRWRPPTATSEARAGVDLIALGLAAVAALLSR